MKLHCWLGTAAILLSIGAVFYRPSPPRQASVVATSSVFPLSSLLSPRLQDVPEVKGPSKHKVDAKLSVDQKDGQWQFRVAGTTDLPEGTSLKARLYVVDVILTPRGERQEDEEQLSSRRDRLF